MIIEFWKAQGWFYGMSLTFVIFLLRLQHLTCFERQQYFMATEKLPVFAVQTGFKPYLRETREYVPT